MKLNLDSLKTEIDDYLKENGFLVFHGFSRSLEDMPEIDWDTKRYPDYKQFLHIAKRLDVRLIVLHHREFSSEIIERAIDDLPSGVGNRQRDVAGRRRLQVVVDRRAVRHVLPHGRIFRRSGFSGDRAEPGSWGDKRAAQAAASAHGRRDGSADDAGRIR